MDKLVRAVAVWTRIRPSDGRMNTIRVGTPHVQAIGVRPRYHFCQFVARNVTSSKTPVTVPFRPETPVKSRQFVFSTSPGPSLLVGSKREEEIKR